MKRSLIVTLNCLMIAGSLPSPQFQQNAISQQAQSKTYYIRTDGTFIQNCNGLVNAPYPGSGVNQSCAWDHPFRALPPMGTPLIAGGDTLIINAGREAYRMGWRNREMRNT